MGDIRKLSKTSDGLHASMCIVGSRMRQAGPCCRQYVSVNFSAPTSWLQDYLVLKNTGGVNMLCNCLVTKLYVQENQQ